MSIIHIGICVSDLDRSVNWYSKWFGFREVKRFEKAEFEIQGALISLGEQSIEILAPQRPIEKDSSGSGIVETLRPMGINHIAINVADIEILYAKFREAGVMLITDLIGGRFFFCKDPDGTVLEIRGG